MCPMPRPVPAMNLSSSSPNLLRHSGLCLPKLPQHQAVPHWGHVAPFPGVPTFLLPRESISPGLSGRLGVRGRWNSRALYQHYLTSFPKLYQERREPISLPEASLNSRVLDTRQLQPQPPHESSQGVWGFALHVSPAKSPASRAP